MQVETRQYEAHGFTQPSTELTQSKLDKSILNIIKKEGYITFTITKNKISSNGGNYLGVLYEVDVKGKTVAGDKETAIFVKCITPGFKNIDIVPLEEIYKKEIFFYKEFSRIIEDVQDEADVPEGERFKMVKAFGESNLEAIMLENMTRRGFKTWNRMDIVTPDMADICIKQLARFHGLSFVLKKNRSTFFEERLMTLVDETKESKHWKEFVNKMTNDVKDYLEDEHIMKVQAKVSEVADRVFSKSNKHKICLCHGDYKPNNIMIKENEGTIIEAIPVDYQLSSYSCPFQDFFYFIYTSTDHQFRKSHMDRLKVLYYTSMETFLQYFDIDIKTVFPRNVFNDMFSENLDYGLLVTVLFLPYILVSEKDAPNMTEDSLFIHKMKLDERYKLRMAEAIQECIEWGIL